MIQGRFGDNGQIYFDIELIDDEGLTCPVEAMLDTGFTELLAMNKQDVESLDWSFLRQDQLMTAQGEAAFDIYLGRLMIDGQEFEVPVFAGSAIQEILLGSQWLKVFTLVANYGRGEVYLDRT
jgi:predicted aspartyl protease